jgi:ABC-type dipeptide/oligopeptide/nickel transport system permease subunit
MEYRGGQAIGVSVRIIARHIMPNCLAIYLILATYLGLPLSPRRP